MSGLLHWLDVHSGSVSGVATVVLVVVTAWYVILTARIAKASRDSQRAYVFVDLVPESPLGNYMGFVITNDGTRPAQDLKFEIAQFDNEAFRSALADTNPFKVGLPYVAPGRSYKYHALIDGSANVFEQGSITIRIHYRDAERSYDETAHFDMPSLAGVSVSSFGTPMDGCCRLRAREARADAVASESLTLSLVHAQRLPNVL